MVSLRASSPSQLRGGCWSATGIRAPSVVRLPPDGGPTQLGPWGGGPVTKLQLPVPTKALKACVLRYESGASRWRLSVAGLGYGSLGYVQYVTNYGEGRKWNRQGKSRLGHDRDQKLAEKWGREGGPNVFGPSALPCHCMVLLEIGLLAHFSGSQDRFNTGQE